jgi:dolichol-phosphate mannosyltransferase
MQEIGPAKARRTSSRQAPSPAAELSVVVPTFNEAPNVAPVIERVAAALKDIDWEIIFVDDNSPDGTYEIAKDIALNDTRIRCIRRIGRRGLSGACIEGILSSSAPFVAVIDADLQHDETLLCGMLAALREGQADLVIGSRYLSAANKGLSPARLAGSKLATAMTRQLLGVSVSDPMSGFFMMKRDVLEEHAPRLSTQGFKILADILASTRGKARVLELPYTFRSRLRGESKLDTQVTLDFLGLLISKATGNIVPVRFVTFALVGVTGLFVHLATLKLGLTVFGLTFPAAQTVATFVAMTSNFFLNNAVTYRDRRLTGFAAVKGLAMFIVICAVGAVSNIGLASWLYANRPVWWLAGLFGSLVGAVWNFAVSTALVWRK